MLHSMIDQERAGIDPGSPEYEFEAQILCEEAMALLSPGARHDNIVRLQGVIQGSGGSVRQLVFELADEASLDTHIRRLLTSSKMR